MHEYSKAEITGWSLSVGAWAIGREGVLLTHLGL
jgi:hypothetical protein